MQKILTALLTIIFLQLQVYSFPICAVAFSKCDLNLLTTKNECNARQKYSKGTKEPEIRPTNEYYLNPVEQNISLFADIDVMSVSNTVSGIVAKIVSGAKATEAIREQANINVAESYSNIGNPQGKLADLVFSNSLVESANRDLENGRYITGTIKGLIATTQTALIFTGLGESVAGIRTVAGTSGYNAVATNATSTSIAGTTTETKAIVSYYPINDGALIGTKKTIILQPGTIIDRYGDIYGRYFSPVETPLEMRALPHNADLSLYNKFIVVQPLQVEESVIAPAFNKIGFGTQYRTNIKAKELIEKGFIKKLNRSF